MFDQNSQNSQDNSKNNKLQWVTAKWKILSEKLNILFKLLVEKLNVLVEKLNAAVPGLNTFTAKLNVFGLPAKQFELILLAVPVLIVAIVITSAVNHSRKKANIRGEFDPYMWDENMLEESDGRRYIEDSDGRLYMKDSDGLHLMEWYEGLSFIEYPDGRRYIEDADGLHRLDSEQLNYTEDSRRRRHIEDSDGQIYIEDSDGLYPIEEYYDGLRTIEDIGFASEVKVNDVLIMGNIYVDKKNRSEDIKWRVLDKQGDNVLLLSENVLDTKRFNDRSVRAEKEKEAIESDGDDYIRTYQYDLNWANCSLRTWLNQDFIYDIFSSDERKYIIDTTISTPDIVTQFPISGQEAFKSYTLEAGEDVQDQLFLLSAEEYEKYLTSDSQRESFDLLGYQKVWWLRSQGYSIQRTCSESENYAHELMYDNRFQCVGKTGKIDETINVELTDKGKENVYQYDLGMSYNNYQGVRPAMWIHIG